MRIPSNLKRFSAVAATLALSGAALLAGAEVAAADGGLVDTNALLRLLDFYDLNPLD